MSRWKKSLITIVVTVLLLSGGTVLLIATTSGLHLLLNSAARWVPGLEIGHVEGGWRNLTLRDVQYKAPGVTVDAKKLHLAVRLGCLKQLAFCIDDLSLNDINLVVDSKKLPPASKSSAEKSSSVDDLSTPYPLTLRHFGLQNIHLVIDDSRFSLRQFSSGLYWQGRALTLTPTHIRGVVLTLPKVAETSREDKKQAAPAMPLGEQMQQWFAAPLLPDLPDFRLPLTVDIQELVGENLRMTGSNELVIDHLLLKADSEDQRLRLKTLQIDAPQGTLNANGQVRLSDNWPLDFTANGTLNIQPLQGQQVKLALTGSLRDQTRLSADLSGPLQAELKAETALATAGLPLSLTLKSSRLRWPLTGTAHYQADDIDFSINGRADHYLTSFHTTLKGNAIPPAEISMEGKGDHQHFNLSRLRLSALQGHADLSGVIDWSRAISWRSELAVAGIDTGKVYPEWPAKLDGSVSLTGSLHGNSWQLRVPQLSMHGNVKQNRLTAEGSLYGNSYQQWQIPAFRLALGSNKLTASGSVGETIHLDAEIDAPLLDSTLPGLGGTAKGYFKARGNRQTPQLLTNLSASGLRWQSLRINRMKLEGDLRSDPQISGQLALAIDELQQQQMVIDQLRLRAEGNEQQHQITLNLKGSPVTSQLKLQGHFSRQQQRWQGKLMNTHLATPVGEWRLSQPMSIDYLNSRQSAVLGPHCWLNPNAKICLPKAIEVGPAGHAHVVVSRFDLAMLQPVLTTATTLSGIFSGDAAVSWNADGRLPQGKVALEGHGVQVIQQIEGNQIPIAFDKLNLNASVQDNRASLNWGVRIVNSGQLTGDVHITDPQVRRTLSGNVSIDNVSLSILNPLLEQGGKVSGALNSSLRLGGTLLQPQLFGQLALRNATFNASELPIELKQANMAMLFSGMRSTMNGLLKTAQGQISLSGNADWSQPENWRANIAAKGDRVRVTVPPMVRMDVSPDLQLQASPSLLNLEGRVDIPWARIRVEQLPPTATGISADEVMLDRNLKPISSESGSIPINSNLKIYIGNDVQLDAFGLQAKLTGALRLIQDHHGLGLNGQITIPSGRYHAYGQDLIVRKGELQFSGVADQPYLNLEAIRNPEATENAVIAGIRVTGLSDEPRVEIFSDPAMSQQEALSYLLRGQPLGSGGADGNAITSALVGLGIAQSGQVVGKIGETFGVSNLALDTAGVGDSQQVQVSGSILPGLQVKYGIGIFDSLATLTLRYRLMPRLYLEAVSGLDQAIDILYQFEF